MFLTRLKLNWPYALGEIALITIGVLLAFGVDGWREYRADRQLEEEYIYRITSDLRSSLESWDEHVSRLESGIAFLKSLQQESPRFVDRDNVEEMWTAYTLSHWRGLPAIRSSAFEELVSTGRLALIQDVALRDEISNFYSTYAYIFDLLKVSPEAERFQQLSYTTVPSDISYRADVLGEYDPAEIQAAFDALRSHDNFFAVSNAQQRQLIGAILILSILEGHVERVLGSAAKG